MAETGEELDEFEIAMNALSPQFREMELPMDRGLINIRVRRKTMNIGEEEDINFQGGFYRSMAYRNEEKSMGNVVSGEYESLQDELSRTKKELEDAVYLNNKLKNDRDVLLATKQELELEIETMIIQITKEISVLRDHYDNRMSIREHCYEEEIEDLVNLFNANADQSRKTVEMILRQKIKLEDDIKPLNERLRNLDNELAQRNAHCTALAEDKAQLELRLAATETVVVERGRAIEQLQH
jgi:chromosome segregation ATPase